MADGAPSAAGDSFQLPDIQMHQLYSLKDDIHSFFSILLYLLTFFTVYITMLYTVYYVILYITGVRVLSDLFVTVALCFHVH